MERVTNKFGVPYHAYWLRLDDGTIVEFDMAWEEYWGMVNEWNADWDTESPSWNGHAGEDFVGYGNEVDGYRKICYVRDGETGRFIGTWKFFKLCERWVSAYSS